MAKKSGESSKSGQLPASANWLALQKTLSKKPARNSDSNAERSRKRRKLEHEPSPSPEPAKKSYASHLIPKAKEPPADDKQDTRNGESLSTLRRMVRGEITFTEQQTLPGKYLALDCEMVGVGIDGAESSLARISLVNFYGAIQLDEFVRQRERVVDYRTQFSGIRESDMINAKPFDEIQKKVAELLKDRILVGHAVFNDLRVLLLSHPRPMTRDTQYYAGKHKVSRSKYVALRNLVKQELDLTIQAGEHSSVTDARATMAVYRIHRKEWEKGNKQLPQAKKRKRTEKTDGEEREEAEDEDATNVEGASQFPGGGRKGVSSGLTTIVRHGAGAATGEKEKKKWWKEVLSSSKGSMRL
ncbi:hypothetical protein H0H87_005374 [Tephrocybe sp. NHM501043]|nr:hypothetical protein H0H87_005374 [Tephrocybe sp. NHM501043]